jgi:hypothetical protein
MGQTESREVGDDSNTSMGAEQSTSVLEMASGSSLQRMGSPAKLSEQSKEVNGVNTWLDSLSSPAKIPEQSRELQFNSLPEKSEREKDEHGSWLEELSSPNKMPTQSLLKKPKPDQEEAIHQAFASTFGEQDQADEEEFMDDFFRKRDEHFDLETQTWVSWHTRAVMREPEDKVETELAQLVTRLQARYDRS